MINHLWQESKKRNITLHTQVMIPPQIGMEDADICVLIGNAFDNAMEACDRIMDNREIWVEMRYEKGCLLFGVKNRYDGNLNMGGDGSLSSRKEGMHGMGLFSMERICNKYHGHLKVTCEGDIFSLEVMLYC